MSVMKVIRYIAGGLLLLLFLVHLRYQFLAADEYAALLARMAPDHHIGNPGLIFWKITLFFLAAFLALHNLTDPLFYRNIERVSRWDRVVFVLLVLLFLLYHLGCLLPSIGALFLEDNLFESLTAFCAVSASILLLRGMRRVDTWQARFSLLAMAGMFFFFGMEEISWGQHIFHWKTPRQWQEINYQHESNLHNLFNPLFPVLYPLFNLILALFFQLAAQLRVRSERFALHRDFMRLLPAAEASFYSLFFSVLVVQCGVLAGELTEETVAVVGFSYALRQQTSS